MFGFIFFTRIRFSCFIFVHSQITIFWNYLTQKTTSIIQNIIKSFLVRVHFAYDSSSRWIISTPWSLIGNLFAPFFPHRDDTSLRLFIFCQAEHFLPFMHRLIQHLDFSPFLPAAPLCSLLAPRGSSLIVPPIPLLIFPRLSAPLSVSFPRLFPLPILLFLHRLYFSRFPREPTWYKAYSIITSHEQRNASAALFHHFWSLKYLAPAKSLRAGRQ